MRWDSGSPERPEFWGLSSPPPSGVAPSSHLLHGHHLAPLPEGGEQRREQEEKRDGEAERGERAGDEGGEVALGEDQGLPEVVLHEGPQHEGQNQRRRLVAELPRGKR